MNTLVSLYFPPQFMVRLPPTVCVGSTARVPLYLDHPVATTLPAFGSSSSKSSCSTLS